MQDEDDNCNMLSIYATGDIISTDIEITIDNRSIDFTITDRLIKINAPKEFGLHTLKIVNRSNKKFSIDQVLVDGDDLRRLLYLSWSILKSGQRVQPCTTLQEHGQSWVLPYGYPLSYWMTTANHKINNKHYGQDLSKFYHLYFPNSEIIEHNNIPKIIKNFYQYNFDFCAVPRENLDSKQIPYMRYKKKIPQSLMQEVITEICTHINDIQNTDFQPATQEANQKEFDYLDQIHIWKVLWLFKRSLDDMSIVFSILDQFPAVQKLIDFIGVNVCFVSASHLPPGQFIYPHIDDCNRLDERYLPFKGCTQLYIPIIWPDGASMKFADVGTIPLDSGPIVLNVDHFTHTLVNTSTHERLALIIRTDQNIINDCEVD